MSVKPIFLGISLVCLLSGCSSERTVISEPTAGVMMPAPPVFDNQGSIFNPATARLMFDDQIAKHLGEIVIINISENGAENNNYDNESTVAQTESIKGPGSTPSMGGWVKELFNLDYHPSSTYTSTGKTQLKSSNQLTGTLAATITDVLPNGYLRIGGDKRILLEGKVAAVRFTGLLNGRDLEPGNYIASKKIANFRLEQDGNSKIADQTVVSWLQHYFMSVLS